MTTANLLDSYVTWIASAIPTATVKKFWRLDPTTAMRVMVDPVSEGGEDPIGIGDFWLADHTIKVFIEKPWDDTVVTGEAVIGHAETVRGIVDSHRSIAPDPQVGRVTECVYYVAERRAGGVPVFVAEMTIAYEVPRHQ
jgi:hypothetical protein